MADTNENMAAAENNAPAQEEVQRTKDLKVGETVIATVTGKVNNRWQSVPVLYGNLCKNYVNGEIKQIREDVYDNYVQEFLQSDDGKEYRIPTKEQLQQAKIEMKNQISDFYSREEAKKKAAEEQAKRRAEDEARIERMKGNIPDEEEPEQAPSEEPEQPQEEPQPAEQPAEEPAEEETEFEEDYQPRWKRFGRRREQQPEEEPQYEEEPQQEPEEPEHSDSGSGYMTEHDYMREAGYDHEGYEDVAAVRPQDLKFIKIMLTVLSVLMFLGIAAGVGLTLFGDQLRGISLANSGAGELTVNGEKYVVPLSTVEVQEGESKTVFYAITTVNENGTITYKAYPIGEWLIGADGVVQPKE